MQMPKGPMLINTSPKRHTATLIQKDWFNIISKTYFSQVRVKPDTSKIKCDIGVPKITVIPHIC